MTLTSTTNRVNYSSTAGLAAYPIPFAFQDATDIYLFFNKALCSTGFTVSGGSGSTGTLTFTSPPPQATDLIIVRWMDLTQTVDLSDHDALPAAALEQQGLDRLVMLIQQADELNDRTLSLEPFSCYTGLTVPDPVAGKVLAWKSDLSGLENVTGGEKGDTGATGAQGPAGAGSAPTVTDCSVSVTIPEIVSFVGSGLTVAVTQGSTTPKQAVVTITAAPPTTISPGTPSILRFTGVNNGSAPTRDFDLASCGVTLRVPSTGATLTVIGNPGDLSKTVNTATAGPAINGRDQAGAFSAGSWLYLYYIAKADGTIAGIASAVAPPTGPTLPTDYVAWAFATAVYYTAGSALTSVYVRGRHVWVRPAEQVLSGAGSGAQETIDISARAPALSESTRWSFSAYGSGTPRLRVVTGVDFGPAPGAGGFYATVDQSLPYVSSNVYFLCTLTNTREVWFHGYELPVG